jgi:membrane protein
VTLLLWIYYSSLIFFFGAEFTQVYASKFGSGVAPSENAAELGSKKRHSPPPEDRQAAQATKDNGQPHPPRPSTESRLDHRSNQEPQ